PRYCALIACEPGISPSRVQVAVPALNVGAHPLMSPRPSKKTIVPVGVPALPVTLAVKVTGCWKLDGLAEETRLTVAVLSVTTWPRLAVVPAYTASPE